MLSSFDAYRTYASSLDEKFQKVLFTKKEQVEFLKDFSELLPYVGAPGNILEFMASNTSGNKKMVAKHMSIQLERGESLAFGMEGWFDHVLVEAVRVGENQGVLEEAINKTLCSFEAQSEGLLKALSQLIWPSFMIVGVIGTMKAIEEKFFPIVIRTIRNDYSRMPPDMKVLWETIEFLNSYGFAVAAAFITVCVALNYTMKNYTGQYRESLDRYPLFSTYRILQGAEFMQLYSILKSINVTEMDVIKLAKDKATPYYRQHLNRMHRKLSRGQDNIVDAINTGLIERSQIERLTLLSGASRYDEALSNSADKVYSTTINNLDRTCKVLSVLGILIAAWGILIIILGVMSIDQLYS